MNAAPEASVAGLGARSYAFLINWHIRALLAAGWTAVTFALLWLLDVAAITIVPGAATPWLLFGPAVAMYLLYHPVCEIARNGRSPGKRIAGLRVVDRSGGDASAAQHFVRNLMRLVDALPAFYALGVVIALLHPEQLRLGDITAATVLVYDEPGADPQLR